MWYRRREARDSRVQGGGGDAAEASPLAQGRSPRAAAGSGGSRVAGRAGPCFVMLISGHLETCGWRALCICVGLPYTTASPGTQ